MRDLFRISTSSGSHSVSLSLGDLNSAIEACKPTVIIADEIFRSSLASDVATLFIPATEEQKDIANIGTVIEACRTASLTRNGRIVAVGGGVIQDIACFVASVYMRGVEWTYVPTTLLAMVDSCIGGKSSINVNAFKNLAGTFHPPAAIVIPPSVLATLPEDHIAAGRLEAAKICFARGKEIFREYVALDGRAEFQIADAARLVELSLGAKKWFVEVDEFDRAERLLLNFGHTFGHAIESCTAYSVPHGVAVGIGCLAASVMSSKLEPAVGARRLVQALERHVLRVLAGLDGLAVTLAAIEREHFIRYLDADKKHGPAEYRLILIAGDGTLFRCAMARSDETRERIWRAFCLARDAVSRRSSRGR